MNAETATPFPTSPDTSSSGGNGLNGSGNATETVHRLAQRVHEAVDTLEQKLGQGGEKMMSIHQEYGDMAREQVRAQPLAAVGIAFAAGYVFARLFSR
ncbi:hypothetical protein [Ramlibacter albus]|uniref:DUF883 domain-containing protein n=1 Tax=Ramlibacter albus TaxID=2079448 RepID=A0A923MAW0_9BURK|nr:hypothetical protein [Ramlibacter albus]MBC5765959.1 hypothetical protein [Ramlibacter albus]